PGCGAEADAHLAGEYSGKGGLAEAGRPMKEHMVQRLTAAPCCSDEHPQVFPRRLLADELVEALGPERRIGIFAGALGGGDSGGVGGHQCECSTRSPEISTQSHLRSSQTENDGLTK